MQWEGGGVTRQVDAESLGGMFFGREGGTLYNGNTLRRRDTCRTLSYP